MNFRPVRSDTDDQTIRPTMLNTLSKPANPPPTAAETPNMSWHISDDWPRMPMPAVTFKHSKTHSSQNCGVFQARSTETSDGEASRFVVVGTTYPSGRQSPAGTRTAYGPNI